MEQKTQRSAGMEDILAAFPDRETFDRYWEENYVPVTYEDVKEAFEDFVTSAGGHIFCPITRRVDAFPKRILRTIFHRRRSLPFRMV